MLIGSILSLLFTSIILFCGWSYFQQRFSISSDMLSTILLYIPLRSFYIIFRRVFYGADLVRSYVVNEIIAGLIMLYTIVYICGLKNDELLLESFILTYLVFIILSAATFFWKYKTITSNMTQSKSFDKNKVSILFFKYGITSMIGTVASTGTGYLSVIITGIYLNNSDAGIYASILSIVSVLTFVPKLFTQVFLPEFSKLYGENKNQDILHILRKSTILLLITASIICLIIFIFSENILSVFGDNFRSGSLVLRILLPSVFIRMISIPFVSFLSGTKYVIFPNIGGFIIFIVSLVLWIILIPTFGLIGIAMGYTFGITIGIGFQIIIAILKIKSFQVGTD